MFQRWGFATRMINIISSHSNQQRRSACHFFLWAPKFQHIVRRLTVSSVILLSISSGVAWNSGDVILCSAWPSQTNSAFYRGLEIRKLLSSLFEFSPTHIDLRYDGFPSVKNALYFFVTGFRYSTKGFLYTGNLVFSGCYFSYFYILWENVGQFVKPS